MSELNPIQTQVLVVGAGAAGLTAAISASRNGASTVLVENHGFLGGISSTLSWLGFHDQDYRLVVKGLPLEFVRRLQENDAASEFSLDPKVGSVVSIDGHFWKCLAVEMSEEAGVQIMLDTRMVDTIRKGDRICGIVVEHKTGRQEIRAQVTLDCTGDGDVAARGGVGWEKGGTGEGEIQAPTLVFRLGGADLQEFLRACKDPNSSFRDLFLPYPDVGRKFLQHIDEMPAFLANGFTHLVNKARESGDYHVPQARVNLIKLHRPGEFLIIMTKVAGLDPTNVKVLSRAYCDIYKQVPELIRFFQNYVPGFSQAYLLDIAPMLGIRESRRILGDYVLNQDDIMAGRVFDDVIALGGYQIDIHQPDGTIFTENVPTYDIPYRCLIAGGVEGLLMAGKCFSATHEGIASTRVIPICMAQGQAAGTAAALSATSGVSPRDIQIRRLQEKLVGQGGELRQTLGEPNWEAIEKLGRMPRRST